MMDDTKSLNTLSNNSMALSRRVSFPKSDNELVTGYLEPANPWEHVCMIKSIPEIAELYITSCQKHNTEPLPCVLDHLKVVDLQSHVRQPLLSLKSVKLAPSDCEALEEIFKRIQYKTIDFSNCGLNETAVSALFEIIEYYEATNELDISSNARGMTHRGWASCNYMIGHSQELLVLNAEGNPISKLSADNLGSALCTSNLHTLKLEHCGLRGLPLFNLCFKLRTNRILKELWLGHNDLDCQDADTIADVLKANHYLELIDISNNDIKDEGVRHIVTALIMQSKELERRKTLQRAFASDKYDNDENFSLVDITSLDSNILSTSVNPFEWNINSNDSIKDNFDNVGAKEKKEDKEEEIKLSLLEKETDLRDKKADRGSNFLKADVDININSNNKSMDDNVQLKSVKSVRNNQNMGQSMLDKLLSMNSVSSSEDSTNAFQSPSNRAASCIEEFSLIKNSAINSMSFSNDNIISNTYAETLANEKEGEKKEEHLLLNLSSSTCTKAPPTYSSPTITLDTLTETVVIEDTTKMATLSNITKTVEIFPNMIFNESNTLINNSHSNISSLKNQLEVEISTNDTPSSSTPDAQSKIVQVDEEVKSNGLLYNKSSKIEAHKLDCCAKIIDVNRSTKLGEDFDDSHSIDSAFESASEGDISRHLPDELTRLSDSLDTMKFENCNKDFVSEAITPISSSFISYNNTEYRGAPATNAAPTSGSKLQVFFENLPNSTDIISNASVFENNSYLFDSSRGLTSVSSPRIPLSAPYMESNATLTTTLNNCSKIPANKSSKDSTIHCRSEVKSRSDNAMGNSTFTNSGCNAAQRRIEPSCTFLTQSSRTYSQSTDSLCSDNSLDGSTGSVDLSYTAPSQLNEKLTKNDTLTRQQRQVNTSRERCHRVASGLRVLSIWNNNLTKESATSISDLLSETVSLELLNIGKNCLSNDFLTIIKENLTKNTSLNTIGLQSAHLSSKGIETLASILNFGGNNSLKRIDIRDNIIEVESLSILAEVLKSNTMITQIDIDDEPKRLSVGSEAHLEYSRVLENVRSMCLRNEKAQTFMQTEKSTVNVANKKRTGYYMGSRKISLTCHGRPIVDKVNVDKIPHHQLSNKLEVKRKTGTRLRSPVPSPPLISPSSSPSRNSRFQVFRVAEINPSASWKTASSSNVKMVKECTINKSTGMISTLPLSSSLPSIASSTQSIKRLGESPRSRFHVKRIYEDSIVPLSSRPTFSATAIPPMLSSISATHKRSIDHSNGDQSEEAIKRSTNENISTSISKDISSVSCSLLKTHSSTVDNNNDESKNSLSYDQKNSATINCKDTMQLHDNIEMIGKAIPRVDSAQIPREIISKKSLRHLKYASSTSLLSPSNSLSSLSSNDDTDASPRVPTEWKNSLDVSSVGQCPLAIFSENDITLTKNTLTNFKVSTKEMTIPRPECEAYSSINCSTILNKTDDNVTAASTIRAQQKTRKVSLISSNTTAVDKLLTLFHHPETIFQRDFSAPVTTTTTTTLISTSELPSKSEAGSEHESDIKNDTVNQLPQETDFIETSQTIRKDDDQHNNCTKKLFKLSSPPSLVTLCDNNLNTTAITATAAAVAATIYKNNSIIASSNDFIERSKQSFLKAASKQLHDFSKHVIKMNPTLVNLPQAINANSLCNHQHHHTAFSISDDLCENFNKEQAPDIVQECARRFDTALIIPTDIKTTEPEPTEERNTVEISPRASTIIEETVTSTVAEEVPITITTAEQTTTTTQAAEVPTTIASIKTATAVTAETLEASSKFEISELIPSVNVDKNFKSDNDIKK